MHREENVTDTLRIRKVAVSGGTVSLTDSLNLHYLLSRPSHLLGLSFFRFLPAYSLSLVERLVCVI